MIGPCVEVLRQLAKNFNNALGADQGMKHPPPDLSKNYPRQFPVKEISQEWKGE